MRLNANFPPAYPRGAKWRDRNLQKLRAADKNMLSLKIYGSLLFLILSLSAWTRKSTEKWIEEARICDIKIEDRRGDR